MEYKEQKRKDFFAIREELKKIEEYVELVEPGNRFLKLDFGMDDLLYLAKRHGEGGISERVRYYKKWARKDTAMDACFALRYLFERENWELGILEKYCNYHGYVEE